MCIIPWLKILPQQMHNLPLFKRFMCIMTMSHFLSPLDMEKKKFNLCIFLKSHIFQGVLHMLLATGEIRF